jgi:cytochrome b involved in lipid metabolism
MKQTIIIFTILLILAGGFYLFKSKSSLTPPVNLKTVDNIQSSPSINPSITEVKSITLSEIANHNTKTDCWFAIEGNVYNVTDFIASNKHPGKDAILNGCGKDATQMFNNRPDNTTHSPKARDMLHNFLIGVLSN